MANKARRRPSWKNEPRPFYINLINEETGELFETLKVKRGSQHLHNMMKKYGPLNTETRLRQALIEMAEKTLGYKHNLDAKTSDL